MRAMLSDRLKIQKKRTNQEEYLTLVMSGIEQKNRTGMMIAAQMRRTFSGGVRSMRREHLRRNSTALSTELRKSKDCKQLNELELQVSYNRVFTIS